jgi:acetyl esterase
VIVAGESGGGNLTLATGLKLKQDGKLSLIGGLYAMAPCIRGQWPAPDCPSSTENNGIFIDMHTNRYAVGYGIEAFVERNPLAWPSFATAADVEGFPPVVISVNECDSLRDEGVNFYRLLLAADIPARCRQVMGTTHGVEFYNTVCPEISRDTAREPGCLLQGLDHAFPFPSEPGSGPLTLGWLLLRAALLLLVIKG